MEKHRLPRIAWEYQLTGRKNPERPRMRWIIEPEQAWGLDHEDYYIHHNKENNLLNRY
jgi:hypothetical protein